MPEQAPNAPELDRLERWMLEVITHPEGVEEGLRATAARDHIPVEEENLEEVIRRSRALTSLERLRIYSQQYLWRLTDVLVEEFASVRHALGDEEFARVAAQYLAGHPPTHYSLSRLGATFPAFLAQEATDLRHREFLAELAHLERTMEDVFDAEAVDPVSVDDLLRVPPDAWGDVRFRFIPALRLLTFRHPVNAYLQAYREQQPIEIPAPRETWLVVHRRDHVVWRSPVDRDRFTLLSALGEGATLGEAIENCAGAPDADVERIARSLREWFQEWTGLGFFRAVELA